MRRMVLAAIGLICTGLATAAWPLKLDVGSASDPVESDWQQLVLTDTYEGITVTISSTGSMDYRYRTDSPYNGISNEAMWRDFIFCGTSDDLIVTIDGLTPNTTYEIALAAFDYAARNATPRTADWQVDGETVFTASYGIPDVALSTMMPSDEWDYRYETAITSDAAGQIVLQSAPSSEGTYTPRVNGLIIGSATRAYAPAPVDGAAGTSLNATLSWNTGMDPNVPLQANSRIGMHYLYLTDGEPNFLDVTPVQIAAGNPVQATGSYGPLNLDYDKTYYWRVDEGVYVGDVLSGPDDNATIKGNTWSFATLKSFPVVVTSPTNTKIQAGQTAQFAVEYSSLSPAVVTWYKDGTPVVTDSRVTVDTTMTSSTLSIVQADLADEASYTCGIVNGGGSVETDPVNLAIARMLAYYPFEQSGDDAIGVNDGTPVGGMDYVGGVVPLDGPAWAADPNGFNYFELPLATAYPRAGFGNGLDEFTYSFWVKRGLYAGSGRILGNFNDGTNTGLQLDVTGAGRLGIYLREEGGGTLSMATPDDTISEDQWHHVAFTFDAEQVYCYVDGVAQYYIDAFPMSEFADWQYPLVLLARNNRGSIDELYPGQIDDLRIYNYAMDRESIGQLYYDVTGEAPCIYGSPDFDTTGPEGVSDCVVDLYDFADFAADWLSSGLLIPQN